MHYEKGHEKNVPQRDLQVPIEMERLASAILEARKNLTQLRERLDSVLSSIPNTKHAPEDKKANKPLVPLASQVAGYADEVEQIVDELHKICIGLEI